MFSAIPPSRNTCIMHITARLSRRLIKSRPHVTITAAVKQSVCNVSSINRPLSVQHNINIPPHMFPLPEDNSPPGYFDPSQLQHHGHSSAGTHPYNTAFCMKDTIVQTITGEICPGLALAHWPHVKSMHFDL